MFNPVRYDSITVINEWASREALQPEVWNLDYAALGGGTRSSPWKAT
jgi:hypothetical protein